MSEDDFHNLEPLFEEIQKAARLPSRLPLRQTAKSLPNYTILEELHRGGQGVVYSAIQNSTKRKVAVKFILQGSFASERQRFRFEREIDLASRLNHPNIVTVFDGGIAGNQLFYAMELIDGRPLNRADLANRIHKNVIREKVEIFTKICKAVGYAHTQGVIHRDLKPANILIDTEQEPHILDFGLAKVLAKEDEREFIPRTLTGEFVGTLIYVSPEQATTSSDAVDTRSDVYSLGVVFYEFLVGELPYDVSSSVLETLKHISSTAPVLPSATNPRIDRDLETILLKALDKSKHRRYHTAVEFGADLERYLNGQPIAARRDSPLYVLKKTALRYRRTALAGLFLAITLVVSLIAISIFYWQAVKDRDAASLAKTREEKQRQLEIKQRELADFNSYVARIAAADASVRTYATHDVVRNLYQTPARFRNWEYWYIFGRNNLSKTTLGFRNRKQYGHQGHIYSVDFHPTENWLLSASRDGRVIIWTPENEKIAAIKQLQKPIRIARWAPNGNTIAVGLEKGNVQIWSVQSTTNPSPTTKQELNQQKLDRDSITEDPILKLTQVGDEISTNNLPVHDLEFSPDGKQLLVGTGIHSKKGQVLSIELATRRPSILVPDNNHPIYDVAWSPEGDRLAFADHKIKVWDVAANKVIQNLPGHDAWVSSLAFHPNGKRLASSAAEPVIKIWDLEQAKTDEIHFMDTRASFPVLITAKMENGWRQDQPIPL